MIVKKKQNPRPAASLSVIPDRVQHFIFDFVSLSCEGNSAEWRVRRFTKTGDLSDCSKWGRISGSTCVIVIDQNHTGVYWCEPGTGEFSNAVNITARYDDSAPLLLSPAQPVTVGEPVTLSCTDKKQKRLSNVFFYHNDKLLNHGSRGELKISAVTKSDEGFYKCQHSGKDSPRSWMSVRVSVPSPVSSSFPLTLIVALVSGVLLIIFLLFLWCYKQYKDLIINRLSQPESINPASATNYEVTHSDGSAYSSLLHGDQSLYETIKFSTASGNAERIRHPSEDSDYANIDPGKNDPTATDSE
ncbi:uncharacterized protein LOC103129890 [Poecilia formosa]|uniref:uncharacterized protein LOC103129890 n=1 Tax=Poecilia formosa TaxID=48698 RepID=UPI0007B909F1|nr:PREDICTED: uncharacterized protein LOC103129890 [Poecilia formosa]